LPQFLFGGSIFHVEIFQRNYLGIIIHRDGISGGFLRGGRFSAGEVLHGVIFRGRNYPEVSFLREKLSNEKGFPEIFFHGWECIRVKSKIKTIKYYKNHSMDSKKNRAIFKRV